jgi:hypothetical protein
MVVMHFGHASHAPAQLGNVAGGREHDRGATFHLLGARRGSFNGHRAHGGHVTAHHAAAHARLLLRRGLTRFGL